MIDKHFSNELGILIDTEDQLKETRKAIVVDSYLYNELLRYDIGNADDFKRNELITLTANSENNKSKLSNDVKSYLQKDCILQTKIFLKEKPPKNKKWFHQFDRKRKF